jgi:hypothetical protein
VSTAELASVLPVAPGGGELAVSAGHGVAPGLLARLEAVPDPRSARAALSTLHAVGDRAVHSVSRAKFDELRP